MPRLSKLIQHRLGRVALLGVLVGASLVYVVVARNFLFRSPSSSISEHDINTNASAVAQYWTTAHMHSAIDDDLLASNTTDYTQGSTTQSQSEADRQEGQAPRDGNSEYPLSTIGKIFFSDGSGRDYVCSGTAVVSANQNVVDTAGHCLYWDGAWMRNVLFCPLYNNGSTPYSCWAARALEVPSDWLDASLNDLHHDYGMAIVTPNSRGNLTDVVGGAGWAYNQSVKQPYYAYGYPAGYPFDGQTRKSCESSTGTLWQHAGGTVVSIPCNMTGGSSGGGWFIKSGGNWYLNGHNDFTSTIKPDHMFSPYYDDAWYALYSKAQNT